MIAGPYSSNAADPEMRCKNHEALNAAALQVFDKGHIPIIGVNLALPIIQTAGQNRFDEIMMPVSLAIAERCDACLRIAGESIGADQEADKFRHRGLSVFDNINQIPTI